MTYGGWVKAEVVAFCSRCQVYLEESQVRRNPEGLVFHKTCNKRVRLSPNRSRSMRYRKRRKKSTNTEPETTP